jgi:uncharacterized protein (TIGR02246 family)
MRWGLIPSWAKDMSIGTRTLNARSETVTTTSAFRDSIVGLPADELAIRRIWQAHDEAYNRHDAHAVAAVYAVDGDQVNGFGAHFSGRPSIEQNYAGNFAGAGKDATVQDEASAFRFLTSDVAMLDTDAVYLGRSDGLLKMHITSIYVKRDGEWTLVATRNTPKR